MREIEVFAGVFESLRAGSMSPSFLTGSDALFFSEWATAKEMGALLSSFMARWLINGLRAFLVCTVFELFHCFRALRV